MKWIVLTALLVVGTALANNTFVFNINDKTSFEFIFPFDYLHENNTISNLLSDKLPTDLANKLPEEVLSLKDREKFIEENCYKLTGSDEAFEKTYVALYDFGTCVKSQFNVVEWRKDLINADLNLDSFIGKYCRKSQTVFTCFKDFLFVSDACMENIEKMYNKIWINMTEYLIDFLCYKDGHRLAMFIDEGGFECNQDEPQAIEGCAKKILGKKIRIEVPGVDNLPLFIIEKDQCDDLSALQCCVVAKLEGCSKPTPANFANALFKFIKNLTNCEKLPTNHKCVSLNNANVVISSIFMFALTLFVRYF